MTIYIALLFGILIFCCVTLALQKKGERHDALQRRLLDIANNAPKSYMADDELSLPFSERFSKMVIKPMLSFLAQYLRKMPKQLSGDNPKTEKLKRQVYQAGLAIGVQEYQIIRIAVILGAAVFVLMLTLFTGQSIKYCLLAPLFGAYVGYAFLRFDLSSRINKRRKAIEKQLPEVLDLLSINVEAGLGFEQAISHVIENLEGPLIDELTITYREMSMGRKRREALLLFGDRCDINEVKSFVGSIIQAGELGISIKNVLCSQAVTMRRNRRNKVEEKAHKISIKILLPMVIFIFPVIFIILMGPAVVRIIIQFGAKGL